MTKTSLDNSKKLKNNGIFMNLLFSWEIGT